MSELWLQQQWEKSLKEQEKLENKESLEQRVAEFEKKLQEIKLKMESQRTEKKSFLKYFQSRFTN